MPWEKLCTSPSTVGAVFASSKESSPLLGWKLRLRARLDYEALPVAESDRSYADRMRRALSSYGQDATDEIPQPRHKTKEMEEAAEKLSLNSADEPQVVQWTSIRVGRADGVHIISDLVRRPTSASATRNVLIHQDDTVKHSDILAGPREVFR